MIPPKSNTSKNSFEGLEEDKGKNTVRQLANEFRERLARASEVENRVSGDFFTPQNEYIVDRLRIKARSVEAQLRYLLSGRVLKGYEGLCEPSCLKEYWEKGIKGRIPSGRVLRAQRKDLREALELSSPVSLNLRDYPGMYSVKEGTHTVEGRGNGGSGGWTSGFLRGLKLGGVLSWRASAKLSCECKMRIGTGCLRELLSKSLDDLVLRAGGSYGRVVRTDSKGKVNNRSILLVGVPLAVASPDVSPYYKDPSVLAGILMSGVRTRVKTGLGNEGDKIDSLCEISGNEEVLGILDRWGIYRSEVYVGRNGRDRVRIGFFWVALFMGYMPDVIREEIYKIKGVKPRQRERMDIGLNGRLSLVYWDLALSIRWKLPVFSGVLPYCPDRQTIWVHYGGGYGNGLHKMGIEMGLPPMSSMLHEVFEGYFFDRCRDRGIIEPIFEEIKEFSLLGD